MSCARLASFSLYPWRMDVHHSERQTPPCNAELGTTHDDGCAADRHMPGRKERKYTCVLEGDMVLCMRQGGPARRGRVEPTAGANGRDAGMRAWRGVCARRAVARFRVHGWQSTWLPPRAHC